MQDPVKNTWVYDDLSPTRLLVVQLSLKHGEISVNLSQIQKYR